MRRGSENAPAPAMLVARRAAELRHWKAGYLEGFRGALDMLLDRQAPEEDCAAVERHVLRLQAWAADPELVIPPAAPLAGRRNVP